MEITRTISVKRTPRVQQVESLFDIPISSKSELRWSVNLPLDEKDWNIGLIVGPSGCGKSTVANELFPDDVVSSWPWDKEKSIIDGFSKDMGIKDITNLLSSVGFSSPPSWLRPYHVLSTGEKFRVHIARTLAEKKGLAVVDEFTSVIDRTVAKIGSTAVAKAVRRRKQRLVAVSCHYDILEWLTPDWVYEPNKNEFQWVYLQRPEINIEVRRVTWKVWKHFKNHHYLTKSINKSATCLCGYIEKKPVVFMAVIYGPHWKTPSWRGHRIVVMPDYQGAGIGMRAHDYVLSLFKSKGIRVSATTTHPGIIKVLSASKNYRTIRKPALNDGMSQKRSKTMGHLSNSCAFSRLTAGFEYVGPANHEDARAFGLI